MKDMNLSQKICSIMFVLVTFLAGIVSIVSGTIKVMEFLEEKKGEEIPSTSMLKPSPISSPSPSFDPDAEAELIRKENETLKEIQRLQNENKRLKQEIVSSNQQLDYRSTRSTSKLKPSCSSPRGSGSVWYAVVGDRNGLSKVKSQYCGDAFIVGGKTQAARFTSYSEAENFAQYLSRETGYSFWVKNAQK